MDRNSHIKMQKQEDVAGLEGQPVTSTRRFGAKLVVATVWVHRKRQLVRS